MCWRRIISLQPQTVFFGSLVFRSSLCENHCSLQLEALASDAVPGQSSPLLSSSSSTSPYHNFSTSPVTFMTSGHATRRKTVRRHSIYGTNYADDQLPLENDHVYDDPNDPYRQLRIFRRDMVDVGKTIPLSVDVPLKRFVDMFCDFEAKRCKLCNESFHQWYSHSNGIPHQGREGLALELVRAYCGTPEEIVEMFWHRLHTSTNMFRRLPSLSHQDSRIRKKRLQYLLRFLIDRKVLVDTFNVMQSVGASAGRSWEFERLEWVGDNVVKYIFNSHLLCLFPAWEGGMRGRLGYSQFVIDGNEGLARAYDFLELRKLTKSDRVVSKFKSDVVETLFGELQVYLWSTEEDVGQEVFTLPFAPEMFCLRSVVAHVMDELAHVMFMYHMETVLAAVQRIVRENDLHYVKADPSLRGDRRLDYGGMGGSFYMGGGSMPNTNTGPTNVHLSKSRLPYKSGSRGGVAGGISQYLESTNYDRFRQVTPLGGLLPVPFAAHQLRPSPTYLPHLQVDENQPLSRASLKKGIHVWSENLLHKCRTTEGPSSNPNRAVKSENHMLTVPQLKDEGLVPELL